ncbi:MAG: endonuclease III [Myxococcales bacterium]|nr:endonuclease III [Myxococcales bacterium]
MAARKTLVDDATLTKQLRRLQKILPDATCALVHRNGWELLIATILAAQCTDKVVNEVTPALFERYPGPADLAVADVEAVQTLVGRVTFFRNKSKNIIATAQAIMNQHGGEVPRTMEALVELPGVARKTANVVLGTAYGIPSGFVVDTHVARLTNRLGFVSADNPVAIEAAMMERVPKKRWILLAHQLILHGRQTCHARGPKCEACVLAPDCPSAEVG